MCVGTCGSYVCGCVFGLLCVCVCVIAGGALDWDASSPFATSPLRPGLGTAHSYPTYTPNAPPLAAPTLPPHSPHFPHFPHSAHTPHTLPKLPTVDGCESVRSAVISLTTGSNGPHRVSAFPSRHYCSHPPVVLHEFVVQRLVGPRAGGLEELVQALPACICVLKSTRKTLRNYNCVYVFIIVISGVHRCS